jgi:hypothetical protein
MQDQTAAIKGSEFHAQIMAAFWPGPEPGSIDRALAAVDPFRSTRFGTLGASVNYPLISTKAEVSQPHFHAKAMPDFWA